MMKTFNKHAIFGLAAIAGAAMLPAGAQAAVLTCTASTPGGCSMFSPTPASVGNNAPTTTGIQWFSGKIVTLANMLTVGSVSFAAGTKVASDYFVFNPTAGSARATGSATFSGAVRAVVRDRAPLNALTAQFAPTGTAIDIRGGNDLDGGSDTVGISGRNAISFDLRSPTNGNNQDVFLVLSAVPEPATWMMLILGFGLIGYGMRQRRTPTLQLG